MKLVEIICSNCGATAPVPADGSMVKCMFCGTSIQFIKPKSDKGDANPQVESLLTLAESANEAENYEEAYSYFNRVLEIDATHAKAWLGKGLAAVWQSTLAKSRTSEMLPAFKNALKNSSGPEESVKLLTKIAEESGFAYTALCNLAANHVKEYGTDYALETIIPSQSHLAEGRKNITQFINEYVGMFDWIGDEIAKVEEQTEIEQDLYLPMDYWLTTMLTYVYGKIEINGISYPVALWDQTMAEIYKDLEMADPNSEELGEMAAPYSKVIHPADWDIFGIYAFAAINRHNQRDYSKVSEDYKERFEITDPRDLAEIQTPGGGCFVATAIYGTSIHPDLDTLRYFRDTKLRANVLGQKFIEVYYKHGPKLAEIVLKSSTVKFFIKPLVSLAVIIAKITK